jgi:hypothetical protein
MATPVEVLITKMREVGFFDVLIFVIALAMFYAILKKFKILGESEIINAAVAAAMAFLIFGYPVIVGFSLVMPLTAFFTHTMVWILTFVIGFMLASFFYPDLPKFLAEHFTSRSWLFISIVIGILIAILSGLAGILISTPYQEGAVSTPLGVTTMIGGVLVFVLVLIIAGSVISGGSK